MNVYAAIDLRGGAAVQLVGGDLAAERVREADPAGVARRWLRAGFRHFHVVDLDAALERGENGGAVAEIAAVLAAAGSSPPGRAASLQVGGGVRHAAAIRACLALGARRVVVGTRAVEDPAWLEAQAAEHPDRLVVAADVRGGEVVTHGWTRGARRTAAAFLAALAPLPLAGVLVTDVAREGREAGVDVDAFRRLVDATPHPLLAAGGVAGAADLEALARAGAAGAVLGMALYTGRLSPADALQFEEDR